MPALFEGPGRISSNNIYSLIFDADDAVYPHTAPGRIKDLDE